MVSANHCSFLDPVLILCIFWKRRVHSLATKDLYRNKLLSFIFTKMHCIRVDKQNFSLNSFHEVTRQLKKGNVVSIFPEGEVTVGAKDIKTFKTGVILMANSAGVPIVPVYLVPPGRWYQRRVALVGDPIDVRSICGVMPTMDDIDRAGEYVRQKEEELKEFYYGKASDHEILQEKSDNQQEVMK